jgi:hypothetical protein
MVDDAHEITVLQLPKFKTEATELIGADGTAAVAVYLIDHPNEGDAEQATTGGEGKEGSAGRTNQRSDRGKIAAHLKGAQ